jgi:hypothetical protein
VTDEEDMRQWMNSGESARARKIRAKHLFRGLARRKDDEFVALTCKSCNQPFVSPMQKDSLKAFRNIAPEGRMRFTCDCIHCQEENQYDLLDHYWARLGPRAG